MADDDDCIEILPHTTSAKPMKEDSSKSISVEELLAGGEKYHRTILPSPIYYANPELFAGRKMMDQPKLFPPANKAARFLKAPTRPRETTPERHGKYVEFRKKQIMLLVNINKHQKMKMQALRQSTAPYSIPTKTDRKSRTESGYASSSPPAPGFLESEVSKEMKKPSARKRQDSQKGTKDISFARPFDVPLEVAKMLASSSQSSGYASQMRIEERNNMRVSVYGSSYESQHPKMPSLSARGTSQISGNQYNAMLSFEALLQPSIRQGTFFSNPETKSTEALKPTSIPAFTSASMIQTASFTTAPQTEGFVAHMSHQSTMSSTFATSPPRVRVPSLSACHIERSVMRSRSKSPVFNPCQSTPSRYAPSPPRERQPSLTDELNNFANACRVSDLSPMAASSSTLPSMPPRPLLQSLLPRIDQLNPHLLPVIRRQQCFAAVSNDSLFPCIE